MARKPGAGRKAVKNEVAATLLTALKFGGVLKTATTTSPEQAHFAWMNTGTAIMFDGIVAAGHPIPADIAGYPHAKLLAEALDNTDKTFTLTVHENGSFEVGSEKYNAIVPSLSYDKVIQTIPDNAQAPIRSPESLMAAFANALKVTVETGDSVLYSSVRFTGNSVMGTNGAVMLETRVDDQLPGIVVPRQFVAAVVKAAATLKPTGMGLGPDWKSFTVWFDNGAWLRTNLYANDTWPEDALELFYNAVNTNTAMASLEPKVWAAINALLPFTAEDDRVIMRPGLVRTHPNRHEGAAFEVKEATATFDVPGKRFLSLAEIENVTYGVLDGFRVPVMLVFGANCRGLVAGLPMLADPEPQAGQGGNWGNGSPQVAQAPSAGGQGGGWAMQQAVEPQPEAPAEGGSIDRPWKGGPEEGLGYNAEFNSVALQQPEQDFRDDDNYVFNIPGDLGFPLNPPATNFTASGWADSLTDEDAGLTPDTSNNTNNNGW